MLRRDMEHRRNGQSCPSKPVSCRRSGGTRVRKALIRGGLFAACLWAAGLTSAADPSSDRQIDNPRSFGHFLGDELHRTISLTVPRGYLLESRSLPSVEREGPWLDLQSVRAESEDTRRGVRVRIELNYQVVNSPSTVLRAVIPGMTLHFVSGSESFDTAVSEWPIVVSPLALGPHDAGFMRPSRAPLLIDSGGPRALFDIAAVLAVLAGLAVAALRLEPLARGRSGGPFDRAYRTVRRLAQSAPGIERQHEALRAVHRAFDQTAGVRVFAHQLEAFFDDHPRFAIARAQALEFYAVSRAEFFADGMGRGGKENDDAWGIEWLAALCSQLRACERRSPSKETQITQTGS